MSILCIEQILVITGMPMFYKMKIQNVSLSGKLNKSPFKNTLISGFLYGIL
ncbi:hypothetical protein NT05LM_0636 [Listeria marthii FSL S4-120]|uniref:Uncharacterized protein n=1 Tax=Listeria marthii FSL S4-120 TaxID=702457 RepID=A0ABN0C018_9LIST|nr:hypothetical protein NT05LM_0636 [Listeria marthii FSL S4-120]